MKFIAYSTMTFGARIFMGIMSFFSKPQDPAVIDPLMKDELATGWNLQKDGTIREIYWRKDEIGSFVVLESPSLEEAKKAVQSLPFARKGYIHFTVIPVGYFEPYEGPFLQLERREQPGQGKPGAKVTAEVARPTPAETLTGTSPAKTMRVLAIGTYRTGASPDAIAATLGQELLVEWKLEKADQLRQVHSRTDQPGTIFFMEVQSLDDARKTLATLPLVDKGLIDFQVIPYSHYQDYGHVFDHIQ